MNELNERINTIRKDFGEEIAKIAEEIVRETSKIEDEKIRYEITQRLLDYLFKIADILSVELSNYNRNDSLYRIRREFEGQVEETVRRKLSALTKKVFVGSMFVIAVLGIFGIGVWNELPRIAKEQAQEVVKKETTLKLVDEINENKVKIDQIYAKFLHLETKIETELPAMTGDIAKRLKQDPDFINAVQGPKDQPGLKEDTGTQDSKSDLDLKGLQATNLNKTVFNDTKTGTNNDIQNLNKTERKIRKYLQRNENYKFYNALKSIDEEEEARILIEKKVKKITMEQLGVDEKEVTPQASFIEDLGADSLDIVELVMAFEEAFDIDITDRDAEEINTVDQAIDYLRGIVLSDIE